MFTHFFIDRPILSAVISILIVLGGAVAMSVAPIEQYPEMAPPQVTVEARYPGATAEGIANTVAAPLAGQQPGHQPGERAEPRQPGAAARAAGGGAAGHHGRQEVLLDDAGALGVLA